MARTKIDTPIPGKNTPWENYLGSRVEEYIKAQFDTKAGVFSYDEANNRYLIFADETNKELYESDPTTYSELLIGAFDAPFNYTASIQLVETPSVQYLPLGSTGNYVKANFDIVDKTGASVGDNVNVTVTIRNGSAQQRIIRSVPYGTQFVLNVDEYLSEGTNIVTVGIVGQNTLAATTVAITYNVINLQLSDTYDISQVYSPNGQLKVTYTISGGGIKHIEWYLDGEQLPDEPDDVIQVLNTTRLKTIELSSFQLSNGRHNIQYRAWVQASDGVTFYSDILFRDFIVNDGFLAEDVIATGFTFPSSYGIIDAFDSPIPLYGATQYMAKPIQHAVLSPLTTSEMEITLGGRSTTYQVSESTVYDYEIKSFTSGETELLFEFGNASLEFNAVIASSEYTDLQEVTNGLVFTFAGNEKNNSSLGKDVWSYGNFRGELDGFAWTDRSGWTENGLLIPEGASFAVDNFKPLSTEARTDGATLEFEFETRRVLDDNAVICDLRTNGVGVLITASEASLTSRGGTTVSAKYKSGESLRVAFVINGDNAGRKAHLMQVYIDGINCGTVNYNANDSFVSNASLLFEGSEDVTILLKHIRTYSRALSDEEILNNYILYRPTTEELVSVYDRNDILDGNGQPSSDKLAAETPILIITGDIDRLMDFTSKNTYLYVPKVEIINNEDPTKNLTILDASMRCQGTSSMNYPIKNMRLYLQKDSADQTVTPYVTKVFDYQGNELTGKQRVYAFKDGAQPVKVWCFKADYAESSSTHNTGVARLWNEVMKNAVVNNVDSRHYVLEQFPNSNTPCRTLAQHFAANDSTFKYDVRTAVDGFPCSIFYHKTENAPLICLGKYNWNNDKSAESVFGFCDIPGFDDMYGDTMECWETITGDLEINQFISVAHWNDTFIDDEGVSQPMWRQNFEARYPDDAGEDSEATRANTHLLDFCTWVSSTNGASVAEDGKMVVDDAELMETFSTEKWDHLDVYKVAAYYIYLMRFGGVDQTVKNSMLTSEDGEHYFFINYDNDTINGLVNSGLLKLGYDVHRQSPDPDDPTTFAYAGHDSVLWNNLEADEEFMEIVKVVDQALFVAGLKYTNVIDMFNNKQSAKWSERLHNYDYTFKYLDPYTDKGINNLLMLQGPRRTHREWWLSHRFALYDGINETGQFRGSYVQLRPNNSGDAIAGDAAVITPAVDGQVFGWSIGNAQEAPHAVTGEKDTPITFNFNDASIRWYIGGYIFFFNIVYAKKMDLSAISRVINRIDFTLANSEVFDSELQEVILGTPQSSTNTHLTGDQVMNLAQLKYLTKFQMCNYKAVTNLDFSANEYLEVLDLRGCDSALVEGEYTTGTTGVTLPVASPLQTIYFPNTIQSVVMKDLLNLQTLEIDGNGQNVILIDARNCAVFTESIDWLLDWIDDKDDEFLADVTVNVTGIDWTGVSVSDLVSLGAIGNLTLKGKIVCSDLDSSEKVETLINIFGGRCFDSTNDLWISGETELQFFSGPDEVLEGTSAQFAFVVINGTEGTTTYSLAGTPTGVSIQENTGLLIASLTGSDDFSVVINAVFTEEQTGAMTIGTKTVTIKKETYPSADDIIITGPSTLTGIESEFSAEITDTDYTGQFTHSWEIVATDPGSDTDITDYFEIWSAPSDQLTSVIRRTDSSYIMVEGSLVFKLTNRLGDVVTQKSYNIAAVSPNIAVSRATNEPIMDAFWNAYGENGSLVATRGQKISNRNYITKLEAISFSPEDLNPTATQTGSIFYPQRNNITHFEELQYFTGVTEIPDYCFRYCTSLSTVQFHNNLTEFEDSSFAYSGLSGDIILPYSVTTISDSSFRNCTQITSFTSNSVIIVGSSVFHSCTNLRSIYMPSVESFGSGFSMLNGCINLVEVYLPKCTYVGYWLYSDPSTLKPWRVTLGAVTNGGRLTVSDGSTLVLSKYATEFTFSFGYSRHPFVKLEVEEDNPTYYALEDGSAILYKSDDSIVYFANAASVYVPDGVTKINNNAGNGHGNIVSVDLGNVEEIDNSAFSGCTGLTSISLPNSIISIGNSCFLNAGLTSLNIDCEFAYSGYAGKLKGTHINSIYVGSHVQSVYGLSSELITDVHNDIVSLIVDENNSRLVSVDNCIIDTSDNTLVLGCKTSIIPNTVTRIGYGAFAFCKSLAFTELPSNIVFLDAVCFSDAIVKFTRLTNLTFVTRAFFRTVFDIDVPLVVEGSISGTSGIETCTIPDVIIKVPSIPQGAFGDSRPLKTIDIDSSILSIDASFNYCTDVETIYVRASTAPTLSRNAWGTGTSATGYNNRQKGTNMLYVPANATGYDTGDWLNVLCNPDYGGFTLSKTL